LKKSFAHFRASTVSFTERWGRLKEIPTPLCLISKRCYETGVCQAQNGRTKGLRKNNFAELAPKFKSDLAAPIEQIHRNPDPIGISRILCLRRRQRWDAKMYQLFLRKPLVNERQYPLPYQIGRPQSSFFLYTQSLSRDPPIPTRYILLCIPS